MSTIYALYPFFLLSILNYIKVGRMSAIHLQSLPSVAALSMSPSHRIIDRHAASLVLCTVANIITHPCTYCMR